MLSGEDVKGQLNAAQEYYCLPATDDLLKRIQEKGKFHTDCDQWIADLSKEDFFIGTRVHGVIAALLAGTPAVLITHDNRTREMADTMGIPSIAIDDFNIEMLNDYAGMAGNLDFETFNLKTALNHSRFRDFYLACGISSDWD